VILTAVKMPMLVFWVVTACGLVGRYQRFGEKTASIFKAFRTLVLKMDAIYFSETLVSTYESIWLKTQKTNIGNFV
jgi:hypothetical protein